ncbi:MAG: trimethylamine methyltransferase family protein, partial [Proteobacteria bacterium]|nr:trimethylamine methyltransferase family protein [Pseudomonadota bacterium]
MDEQPVEASARRNRGGGREAKRAARAARSAVTIPYITRSIPYFEVLGEEGLATIEANADTILAEIGIDFRDDPESLEIWKAAGAEIDGERVRFPRGLCRSLVQKSAPREFVQHARNPARNVVIGGRNTVFAPAYGSPFIRSLDEGRRYARIEDFRNFVKLAYMAPALHHSGGTICEPVDLPVNKRHFDMVYSHMKYSDKAFMGSVTAPERAEDTVEMAKILFGPDFIDPVTGRNKTVLVSLINANSPMTFDATMLGALKVYARANQATIVTPFILAGAMSPVTVAGTAAPTLAESLAGMAFAQLVNPGAPIPPSIQVLTGITHEMVADAPRFEDLAGEILRRLEGRTFVAHNVRFDYGFIRTELRRAGHNFSAPQVCTVRLSRHLYPDGGRHNLDSVMARHGITSATRHRALPDAQILAKFWRVLRAEWPAERLEAALETVSRRPVLPPQIPTGMVDDLPES